MLVCYAFEDRNRSFILGFAFACALGSLYGFLQGAWPFGLVEAVWGVVAIRRSKNNHLVGCIPCRAHRRKRECVHGGANAACRRALCAAAAAAAGAVRSLAGNPRPR